MKVFERLNLALDDGLSKKIFDHVRNYLMCVFLLAVGISEFQKHTVLLFGFAPIQYAGATLIGLSCVLIGLNLYDGVRQLSKLKYHYIFTICLVILYIFLSVRIVEMALNFRSAI